MTRNQTIDKIERLTHATNRHGGYGRLADTGGAVEIHGVAVSKQNHRRRNLKS